MEFVSTITKDNVRPKGLIHPSKLDKFFIIGKFELFFINDNFKILIVLSMR